MTRAGTLSVHRFLTPGLLALLALSAAAIGAASCTSQACTDVPDRALKISVVDDLTGESICDAYVNVAHGEKNSIAPVDNCEWHEPSDQLGGGRFIITVIERGYRPASVFVDVPATDDGCHLETQTVVVRLTRA